MHPYKTIQGSTQDKVVVETDGRDTKPSQIASLTMLLEYVLQKTNKQNIAHERNLKSELKRQSGCLRPGT